MQRTLRSNTRRSLNVWPANVINNWISYSYTITNDNKENYHCPPDNTTTPHTSTNFFIVIIRFWTGIKVKKRELNWCFFFSFNPIMRRTNIITISVRILNYYRFLFTPDPIRFYNNRCVKFDPRVDIITDIDGGRGGGPTTIILLLKIEIIKKKNKKKT